MDDPKPSPEERERLIEEAFREIDQDAVRSMASPPAVREERRSSSPYHQEPWPPKPTPIRPSSGNWSLAKIAFWTTLVVALTMALLYIAGPS
jgi:hypothetical protein